MSSYRMKYRIGSTQYNIPVQEDISAIPLGTILPYSANSEYPPAGFLFCDGSAVSRTMYSDLFALIGTTFGSGDGSTTFNLPDLTLGEFLEGSSTAGTSKDAGIPNIKGSFRNSDNSGFTISATDRVTGAFVLGTTISKHSGSTDGSGYAIDIDASRSSSVYKDDVTTVQPKSVTVRYIIKAFNATTSSSELIDITQYASALNQKYDVGSDFTIIYPNNGSESSPANVTSSNRYVLSNPFPGYHVHCVAEVYQGNEWGVSHYEGYSNGDCYGVGIYCYQHNSDNIVLVTGNYLIGQLSHRYDLHPNTFSSPVLSQQVPCRVKVWKIGKLPSQSP